jgi:hypothetical protein
VIARDWVLQRTFQAFNSSPTKTGQVEVGIYEFDLGFVVWPVEPAPTDWSRPPSSIGGSVMVIDGQTGQPSIWPRLAAPQVAELYRKSKQAN